MKSKVIGMAIALSSLALAGTANAALISYTSLSAFQSASGALNLIDFNVPPTDYGPTGSPLVISGVTFSGSLFNGDTFGTGAYSDSYLMASGNLTINFAPGTTAAGSELGAYYGNATTLTATAYSMLGSTLSVNAGGATSFGFYGFTASPGDFITTIVLSQTSGANYTAIDDVRWSTASVPEPASLLVLGLGLLGLGWCRHKMA